MKFKFLGSMLLLGLAAVPTARAAAQSANSSGHWVGGWSTAVHTPRSAPGATSTLTFDNQTVRMVIRMTLGGERLRIRFSNENGATPIAIGTAHVAVIKGGGEIIPESDRVVKFGGVTSAKIPAGAPMLSDPVDLKFAPLDEIAVSIFLPEPTASSTFHLLGQHDTYISGRGDFTSAKTIDNPKITNSWYFLGGVEVWANSRTAAIVTLGDSITDGFGAKAQYGDWPNQLAQQLVATKGAFTLAVDNEGIGGNRILYDGAGIDALARLDRDVISQPGVKDLIVLEGINDIGWANMKPRKTPDGSIRENPWAKEQVNAEDVIKGLTQIVDRAHEHGLRVFGGTITPYEGADYFTQNGESVRQEVNHWIRTGGVFDGVFDFDAAVRDPKHPSKFREDLQTGDFLHPNAAGYKAMAACIDLAALRGK